MQKAFIFLLSIFSINTFDFKPLDQDVNYFIKPFFVDQEVDKIEQFYQKHMIELLELTPLHQNTLDQTVQQLIEYDWTTPEIEDLDEVNEETIIRRIKVILSICESEILKQKFESTWKQLKELTRHILIRIVQSGQVESINNLKISPEVIEKAITQYRDEGSLFPLKTAQLAKYLADRLKPYQDELLTQFINLLVLQHDSYKVFNGSLRLAFKGLKERTIKLGNDSQKIRSINKLIKMIQITASLYGDEETQFDYIGDIARSEVMESAKTNSKYLSFYITLYHRILSLHLDSHIIANIKAAKSLFVEFFLPESYTVPTKEYTKFIMLKYLEDGLQLNILERNYKKISLTWVIDLLWTSLHAKNEFIPEEEINQILQSYPRFALNLEFSDMIHFKMFREIIMNNSDLLHRYSSFFSEYYNSGLLFVHYLDNQKIFLNSQVEYPTVFLDFLTNGWKNSGFCFGTSNLPDRNHLEVNFEENYVAYMIIHIAEYARELYLQNIHFQKYADRSDKYIQELLFETPKFNELVVMLKKTFLNEKGLNYQSFYNLKTDSDFWQNWKHENPDLFEGLMINYII